MEQQFDDYRTDFAYVSYYTSKISPLYMRMALLLRGVDMPVPEEGQPMRYLELGFGRGLSLAIHAAVTEGEYWGVDFLQQHCEELQSLTDESGIDCHVLNCDFAAADAMSEKGELPQFDMIALHGIYSWVNAENRQHIQNIIRRNLREGGVVYISYNSEPGWSFFEPVRDLMLSILKRYGDDIDMETRIRETLQYVIAMAETPSAFFATTPRAVSYLKSLAKEDVKYLAQEYFNTTWQSFYFRQVAEDMEKSGCTFVNSADFFSQTGAYTHPQVTELISRSVNPLIRETLRDFAVNNKFRMDYFVKSPRRLNGKEASEKLADMTVRLSINREDVNYEIKVNYNSLTLMPELFEPMLDILATPPVSAKRVGDFTGDMLTTSEGRRVMTECVATMLAAGYMVPFNDNPSEREHEMTRRLNRALCSRALEESKGSFLAASKLAAGYHVQTSDQLFMLYQEGRNSDPEALARKVVDHLYKKGLNQSYQDSVNLHTLAAKSFLNTRLPIYDAIGVEI
jgi:Predicted methyltransferase regulatory domain./Methyltransferase domain.